MPSITRRADQIDLHEGERVGGRVHAVLELNAITDPFSLNFQNQRRQYLQPCDGGETAGPTSILSHHD